MNALRSHVYSILECDPIKSKIDIFIFCSFTLISGITVKGNIPAFTSELCGLFLCDDDHGQLSMPINPIKELDRGLCLH